MTARPGVFNLTGKYAIYSGADWTIPFGFYEEGGRLVDDLTLVDGDTTATSETAAFTDADTGKKISTEAGTGIVDGTTMTYVSPTEVTLSAAATADGVFVATIRSLNLSNYSNHKAQARGAVGGALICEFSMDDSRNAVGWIVPSLAAATTEPLSGNGVWDWRTEGPNGTSYFLSGKVHFTRNVTVS